jgi:hypothetical protein
MVTDGVLLHGDRRSSCPASELKLENSGLKPGTQLRLEPNSSREELERDQLLPGGVGRKPTPGKPTPPGRSWKEIDYINENHQSQNIPNKNHVNIMNALSSEYH